jgi:S1-C subfamily serine protease
MPLDAREQCLLDRAARALGSHAVDQAVAKTRAIIGPVTIPASEVDAQAAWDKLRNGEQPTAIELAALEVVIRLLRPAPLSHGGRLDDLPDAPGHNLHPPELKDLWNDFRKKVQPLLYSIGRVEMANGTHIGTGFLVQDGVLATNRHVLDDLSFGAERLEPGQARILFQREQGANDSPEHTVGIEGVAAIHPHLDMALLAVPKLGRPVVEVSTAAVHAGHRVVAIGYPAKDVGRNPLFLDVVYQGKFGFKRAALGEVLDGTEAPDLFHDCSTTGGNSGSPLFSLESGRAVGIHRAGFFMYRNEALDADALRPFAS